jgi:hypothetical protein
MLLKNVFYSICAMNLLGFFAFADIPPRIGTLTVDKKNVQKLYVAEGRSSMVIFPCNIKTFSTGPTKDIAALVNERDSKILEVWLGKASKQPAGLKVICNDHFFAFDVIPSTTIHQDFVNVRGAYGIPTTYDGVTTEIKGHIVASSVTIKRESTYTPKVIKVISSSNSVNDGEIK